MWLRTHNIVNWILTYGVVLKGGNDQEIQIPNLLMIDPITPWIFPKWGSFSRLNQIVIFLWWGLSRINVITKHKLKTKDIQLMKSKQWSCLEQCFSTFVFHCAAFRWSTYSKVMLEVIGDYIIACYFWFGSQMWHKKHKWKAQSGWEGFSKQ